MGTFKSFTRTRIVWFTLSIVLLLFQELFLYLLGSKLHELGYALIPGGFLLVLITVIDYVRYRHRVNELERFAGEAVANQPKLPEARDRIEEIYQEMLENINIDRIITVGQAGKQKQEMEEYYAMWVHQVKTPIAAMQLLIQMQKGELDLEHEEDQKRMDVLKDMEEELFYMEQYVQMALQYQRMQSDSQDLVLQSVALDTVIRECIRKYAKIMIRRKLPVSYSGTGKKVVTDEKWLLFVLEQVVSNAIKYTKKGSITIDLVHETNWCYIRVRDQGIGINPGDLPRIFEKGYTGYNGHADKRATGIGLYLCKQMLEKLGHTIRVESEVGVGTTVWIGFARE